MDEGTAKPKVSVVMITYNHEDFIADAIEGALMQETDFPYEIIIGEDESEDRTREICIEYAERFPDKIRLFLRSREDVIYVNGRATGRFNLVESLKAARGEYIALCDGDDYWTDPRKLQKQVDFLDSHSDCVVCHHDAMIVDEHGAKVSDSKCPDRNKRDFSADELVKGAWILTLTACFRNVLQEWPPEFFRAFNGDTFLFSLLGRFGRSKYLGDCIAPDAYRKHSGGVWSSIEDDWQRLYHQLTTYYWLRRYYARLGEKWYSQHFALILRYGKILHRLSSAEEIAKDLETRLLGSVWDEASMVSENATDEGGSVKASLSANLYMTAALASFARLSWDQGYRYVEHAMDLDSDLWCDEENLQKVFVREARRILTALEPPNTRWMHAYLAGVDQTLGKTGVVSEHLVRKVRAELCARFAYRCQSMGAQRDALQFAWWALKANPLLVRDIRVLKRALSLPNSIMADRYGLS